MPEDDELERIKRKKLKELLNRSEKGRLEKPETLDKPIAVDEEKLGELFANHRLVLVDFWAAWCGPCLMIAPIIEELAREYAGKVVFAKVDVDRNRGLASKFGIMSIPTLILFENGKPVDMMIGAYPKPAIEEMIKKHL